MQQQQAQGSNAPRNLDFGATKMSIRSNFERQAAIAPLTGKKADFFLASAAERERRSAAQDKARLAVTDRSGSEAESMDSFASSNVTSSPAATKTLRFAEEIPATALAAPSRTKVISFGIDDDEDDDDDDGEQAGAVASEVILASRKAEFASALSDDESDLLVSQVPRNRDLDTDDEESESDDDGNFGINIRSTTTGLGSKGIQVMANAGATSSFSHSSSIGLQRTPSAEKGLSKLSNLSSAIANNPSTSSGSSALGGLQRTSSFEKGLSKLSALSKP
ncbi:hypothetical protein BDR26DRAFT_322602 [Obelidium mucronatum]|nr:hypothetical protein BDR26DRAFT_322602 [Obelidium mucronatum]